MKMLKTWSYWEQAFYRQRWDLVVIGAGFTGLSTALHARRIHPNWRILVVDRAWPPEGASTKNAGFACYGTLGELRTDIQQMGYNAALELLIQRWEGLQYLKDFAEPKDYDFLQKGGVEVFRADQVKEYEDCLALKEQVNRDLQASFKTTVFKESNHHRHLRDAVSSVYSEPEANLNPYKLWSTLSEKAALLDIKLLPGLKVCDWEMRRDAWFLQADSGLELSTRRVIWCTNGFSETSLNANIKAVRNQVVLSKPMSLPFGKENYHSEQGFYYFRAVDGRLLLGGARNKFSEQETTSDLGNTENLIVHLKAYAQEVIGLADFEIEYQWSGILGLRAGSKQPKIEEIKPGMFLAAGFGGMGVALSVYSGKLAAEML